MGMFTKEPPLFLAVFIVLVCCAFPPAVHGHWVPAESPVLTVETAGPTVLIRWDSFWEDLGYYFHFAPLDLSYVGEIHMGETRQLVVDLWDGAGFYVAATGYNDQGTGDYSNIGTVEISYPLPVSVRFPDGDDVLLAIEEAMDYGSVMYSGVSSPDGSAAAITHFDGSTPSTEMRGFVNADGRPETLRVDSLEMTFSYGGDRFSYTLARDGEVLFQGEGIPYDSSLAKATPLTAKRDASRREPATTVESDELVGSKGAARVSRSPRIGRAVSESTNAVLQGIVSDLSVSAVAASEGAVPRWLRHVNFHPFHYRVGSNPDIMAVVEAIFGARAMRLRLVDDICPGAVSPEVCGPRQRAARDALDGFLHVTGEGLKDIIVQEWNDYNTVSFPITYEGVVVLEARLYGASGGAATCTKDIPVSMVFFADGTVLSQLSDYVIDSVENFGYAVSCEVVLKDSVATYLGFHDGQGNFGLEWGMDNTAGVYFSEALYGHGVREGGGPGIEKFVTFVLERRP